MTQSNLLNFGELPRFEIAQAFPINYTVIAFKPRNKDTITNVTGQIITCDRYLRL